MPRGATERLESEVERPSNVSTLQQASVSPYLHIPKRKTQLMKPSENDCQADQQNPTIRENSGAMNLLRVNLRLPFLHSHQGIFVRLFVV